MKRPASLMTRRHAVIGIGAVACGPVHKVWSAPPPEVVPQPYFASVKRVLEALARVGAPIARADVEELLGLAQQNTSAAVAAAEAILDRYTLVQVTTANDGYAFATARVQKSSLIEQGWRVFLIRVFNPIQVRAKLNVSNGEWPIVSRSTGASRAEIYDTVKMDPLVARDWFRVELPETQPLEALLSGVPVEYRILHIYSRDRGEREAQLHFFTSSEKFADVFAKEYRRGVLLRFSCLPSRDVLFQVRDADSRGCMASITITDRHDRVYPLQTMRLAPDLQFQRQIYRADGETVRLPDGEYFIESTRGPEYLRGNRAVVIGEGRNRIEIQLSRWIDPQRWGWYPGDPHIHAAGCAHYEHPTEGVAPETIIRLLRGEGLSVGDVLSWGPGWYYQKQFFAGHAESPPAALEHLELQAANNSTLRPRATPTDAESLLRYDVEVSGFPSSHCGHVALLNLKKQDYPGAQVLEDWPSWNLPILQWARAQGALAGYAHCGSGMVVDSTELPNYLIPSMDGIGTQEAIVDVTHGVMDFLSGCDTQPAAELNAWYHLLNCGFRLALIGETDFPCMSAERPGVGRTYVRLAQSPRGDEGYTAWISGVRAGELYCGDGRSHFLHFSVNGRRSGGEGLAITETRTVQVRAVVAAHLEPTFDPGNVPKTRAPGWGWHLEHARIGKSREVPVELVVNGVALQKATLLADGSAKTIEFEVTVARSSWIALRILPSSHTHPVFIAVDGKPIRASRRSAQWCRTCVDKLWEVKAPFMRESDRNAAAAAFEHARMTYDAIIAESETA